jgi:hypothetical protein
LEKALDALATWRLDCIVAAYEVEIWKLLVPGSSG